MAGGIGRFASRKANKDVTSSSNQNNSSNQSSQSNQLSQNNPSNSNNDERKNDPPVEVHDSITFPSFDERPTTSGSNTYNAFNVDFQGFGGGDGADDDMNFMMDNVGDIGDTGGEVDVGIGGDMGDGGFASSSFNEMDSSNYFHQDGGNQNFSNFDVDENTTKVSTDFDSKEKKKDDVEPLTTDNNHITNEQDESTTAKTAVDGNTNNISSVDQSSQPAPSNTDQALTRPENSNGNSSNSANISSSVISRFRRNKEKEPENDSNNVPREKGPNQEQSVAIEKIALSSTQDCNEEKAHLEVSPKDHDEDDSNQLDQQDAMIIGDINNKEKKGQGQEVGEEIVKDIKNPPSELETNENATSELDQCKDSFSTQVNIDLVENNKKENKNDLEMATLNVMNTPTTTNTNVLETEAFDLMGSATATSKDGSSNQSTNDANGLNNNSQQHTQNGETSRNNGVLTQWNNIVHKAGVTQKNYAPNKERDDHRDVQKSFLERQQGKDNNHAKGNSLFSTQAASGVINRTANQARNGNRNVQGPVNASNCIQHLTQARKEIIQKVAKPHNYVHNQGKGGNSDDRNINSSVNNIHYDSQTANSAAVHEVVTQQNQVQKQGKKRNIETINQTAERNPTNVRDANVSRNHHHHRQRREQEHVDDYSTNLPTNLHNHRSSESNNMIRSTNTLKKRDANNVDDLVMDSTKHQKNMDMNSSPMPNSMRDNSKPTKRRISYQQQSQPKHPNKTPFKQVQTPKLNEKLGCNISTTLDNSEISLNPVTPSPSVLKKVHGKSYDTPRSYHQHIPTDRSIENSTISPCLNDSTSPAQKPNGRHRETTYKQIEKMGFDDLLSKFQSDLLESTDVRKSCDNQLVDLRVKLCVSENLALRLHGCFDDILEDIETAMDGE